MAPNVNHTTTETTTETTTKQKVKKSATRNVFWKLTGNKVDPNLKSKLELPIHSYIYHT